MTADTIPLPEPMVIVRDTDDEPEGGGWIVDCDCEGPLSYSLEPNEVLFTADQLRERDALWQARLNQPIDMVLYCPACGMQHVDEPEYSEEGPGGCGPVTWGNPPHRTHLCHGCGHKWRPADVPTNGVQAVKTKGKDDSPIVDPQARLREAVEALETLLKRDMSNTCLHETAHRGGTIWTICDDCGKKWADDRGGPPERTEPKEWGVTEAVLADLKAALQEPEGEPPLTGRFHHGQGFLVSGTIRIARWDCDTNPPVELRDKVLDWMCATLNAAVERWSQTHCNDDLQLTDPDGACAPPAQLTQGPVAWIVYAPNGNVRLWSTRQYEANRCADENGLTVTPLYATPHPPKQEPVKWVCWHAWKDFGSLGGRNVSWCSKCDMLAFTGNEPYPVPQPQPAIPQGYALVPLEPTDTAMRLAAELRDAASRTLGVVTGSRMQHAATVIERLAAENAALRAASAPAVPPGWKLVPVEPTEAMLKAARTADKEYQQRMGVDDTVSVGAYDHWVAMLDAAPTPPQPPAPVVDKPQQEPVAWMHEWTDPHDRIRRRSPWLNKPKDYEMQPGDSVTPLYDAPQPSAQGWQGLTDAEIYKLSEVGYMGEGCPDGSLERGRAIEAALREKNAAASPAIPQRRSNQNERSRYTRA